MMKIGNREFDVDSRTYIMGILNVTPDSFYDGGRYEETDRALAHAGEMIEQGADIIDIGGESTRPGYQKISEEEEIARVVPVIKAVKKYFDIPVSIDTYKAGVARAALDVGADMVNDIWGLKYDGKMAPVIAEYGAACSLMHNRRVDIYDNFLKDLVSDMKETLAIAGEAGIDKDRIILDPGVGFAKSREQNLSAINHLDLLRDLGYPVLLGTSRKSVIGLTLDLPKTERVEGTIATSVVGTMRGCSFVRVHDVRENFRAVRMTEAIMKG